MSDYTYPAELIKKTEKRIQKQCEGNGIDPKTISLAVKRQGVGSFTARTYFKLDCDVKTKTSAGKIREGMVVEQGQLQKTIDAHMNKLAKKESTSQAAIKMIESLPAQGFGADKQTLSLKGNEATFTEHRICERCDGQGKYQCHTCHGQRQMTCPQCHGSGEMTCMTCGGTGKTFFNGQEQVCNACQGRGRSYCTHCHGQRTVPCTTCNATGFITCSSCQGSGASSVTAIITPTIQTRSQIHIQELDNEPKRMASIVGAEKLVAGGHVAIKTIEQPKEKPKDMAYYEDEPQKETNAVFYGIKMPWAITELKIGNKPHSIAFVGSKGAVCESGKFMDEALKQPLELLSSAAQGKGFVAGLLKDACQWRISRETLISVVQGKRKRAMIALNKTYGLGLTKPTIQTLVQKAHLALKRVTRRPRYIGLIIGLGISAFLFYVWFGQNSRQTTLNHTENIRYLIDFIILLFGSGLTTATIKGAGYFILRSVMRDIGIPIKQIPAAGTAGFYGLAGNIILWGILFFLYGLNY